MSSLESGTLYYGDCLDWMSEWDDQCVDLIYLDPPFNSKTDYNVLYSTEGETAQFRAFVDTWEWDDKAALRFDRYEGGAGKLAHDAVIGLERILGPSGMLAYLTYMAERLEQMHRLLKPTGSIYLHCDPTASHYLKVVMDAIFGAQNFKNEIVWSYQRYTAKSNKFQREHDVILFYGGNRAEFNTVYRPYSEQSGKRDSHYKQDEAGRWFRWQKRRGQEPYKVYLSERGRRMGDVWPLPHINASAKERLGYPTQKPLALVERLIKASSNPGDLVLDPFCGCGTTIDAARRLNRGWAGIDISSFAVDLIVERRLQGASVATKGIPTDLASARKLAREQPFNFESWAVTRLPGFAPNTKKVGDGGVDGRGVLTVKPDDFDSRLALAQIKGGKFGISPFRDFVGVTKRDKAAIGCYVTLDSEGTPASKIEMLQAGRIKVGGVPYPRVQLWPISHYFDGRRPNLPPMNDPYSGKPMQPTLGLFA